ncbi:MAG: tRNA (N6-threonylcarbamoyladenosine(37)-N6)-methyltransferase TrmO [Thermoplasmata archaeon]|nr:MAG: tRNA (N6-threonylcarbamoyladenosine(37)-N6)-methyltransferase TrmO [Thermoplasmata archaeon]
MEEQSKDIIIRPIGHVENGFDTTVHEGYEAISSDIVLRKELSEALDGIEHNSHVVVLFWMDRIEKEGRAVKKLHPKGREDLPLVGVLATRSPNRPNPIGTRAVRLLKRQGNVLKVLGLDALNGSPVLDIKPYSLKHDMVEDAQVPPWAKHLQKG